MKWKNIINIKYVNYLNNKNELKVCIIVNTNNDK